MTMINCMFNVLYEEAFRRILSLVELNIVPDVAVRTGIRYLLLKRAKEATPEKGQEFYEKLNEFVEQLKTMPIAIETDAANEQHYEVPTEYFNLVLGRHKKYSSCFYPLSATSLDEAEEAMLALCGERAELENGQTILELGCGWGSMSLWMASHYPGSTIIAVSNSSTQKEYIDSEAKRRGLKNLTVITANVGGDFKPPNIGHYDRVVSVEMFEHMKNYQKLHERISQWLKPEGKLFVHIFVHRLGLPYHFEVNSEEDWMTKYFFAGGTMPSANLLLHFQDDLAIEKQYYISGLHYSRTLEEWLKRHDKAKTKLMPLMSETYGKDQALKWFVYWRLFYMACSELFAWENGERWGIGHYLFSNKRR